MTIGSYGKAAARAPHAGSCGATTAVDLPAPIRGRAAIQPLDPVRQTDVCAGGFETGERRRKHPSGA
ncbi:MAG TPA: hypothetical protein VFF36_07875, partial [Planctomycetota bacterium]|nr:hypothetical protein [Planctomycetota bacterium]